MCSRSSELRADARYDSAAVSSLPIDYSSEVDRMRRSQAADWLAEPRV